MLRIHHAVHRARGPRLGARPRGERGGIRGALRRTTCWGSRTSCGRARPTGSRFDPPWTTINIGALIGGVAHNVIARTAQIDWEMRPVQPGDADFVHDSLRALLRDRASARDAGGASGGAIVTEVIGEVAGLVPTDDNEAAPHRGRAHRRQRRRRGRLRHRGRDIPGAGQPTWLSAGRDRSNRPTSPTNTSRSTSWQSA